MIKYKQIKQLSLQDNYNKNVLCVCACVRKSESDMVTHSPSPGGRRMYRVILVY